MKVEIINNDGIYCGTLRSHSYNNNTKFTTLVFTGGVVKRFQDSKKTGLKRVSDGEHSGARIVTLNPQKEVFNNYEGEQQ